MEALAKKSVEKDGGPRLMNIDRSDWPKYTLADGRSERSVGAAEFEVQAGGQPGVMRVHSLPIDESPLLIGMSTLRRMGAVIDFDRALAIFKRVAPGRIAKPNLI